MVRRVKSYLNAMRVIENEDELRNMSLLCEPGTQSQTNLILSQSTTTSSGSVQGQQSGKRSQPSPTLSTASSNSSSSEQRRINKFGKLTELLYYFDNSSA